ncbi:MAG: hypothetical protein K0S44_1887 [Bacteroidetes bacterium]|jgi:hypothetical protein|nr:hypothetical protein [Bacteroidota bacterium]
MDPLEQILKEIRELKMLQYKSESVYCNTDEACARIGITNYRYLSQLYKRDLLKRYSRAEGYVYKKNDLDVIREALDTGKIKLNPLQKIK